MVQNLLLPLERCIQLYAGGLEICFGMIVDIRQRVSSDGSSVNLIGAPEVSTSGN